MIAIALSPTIQTASIGIPDTMFLMVLALIVFGPRRLPEIGRQIGKLMYEFRKVSNDFKFQMEEELRASEEADRQQKLEASRQLEASSAMTLQAPTPAAEITTGTSLEASLEASPAISPESPLVEPAIAETYPALQISLAPASSPLDEPPIAAATDAAIAAEPRPFPPQIQPPQTGEPVSATRPFRAQPNQTAELDGETVTESGAVPLQYEPSLNAAIPAADEGRIGTEVQPGITAESEQEARHA